MNKRLLAATKYQVWESRTAVITFYLVLFCIFFINYAVSFVADPVDGGNHGAFDCISLIFLFVAGIGTFGAELRLYLQCGLNRKLLTISLLLSMLALSLIMTVGDFLFYWFTCLIAPVVNSTVLPMLGEMLYPDAGLATRMFVHFCGLTMFSYLGLLVAAIFQQIPKKFRWVYCASLPIGLIALGTKLWITLGTARTAEIFFALFGTPLHAVGGLLLVTAVLILITHLLTMRSYLR
jgi:hypothetical protein